MVVEVYGPDEPWPVSLPEEPLHERIVEALHPGAGMAACWEWSDSAPSHRRFLVDGTRGSWKLRGSYGHPGEQPVPWGRAYWEWHEIVSVCVLNRWQLQSCPKGVWPT